MQRFTRDIRDRFTSNFIFLSLLETLQTGLLVKSGPMKSQETTLTSLSATREFTDL